MDTTNQTPRGVALLAEYLAREGLTYEAFALRDASGRLDRPLIGRLLSGERAKRVSVNLATAIERASEGFVPVEAWESPTQAPEGPTVDRSAEYAQPGPEAA